VSNACIVRIGDPAKLEQSAIDALPEGSYRSIVIKPNWVRHETNPDFPISALVTSSDLIDAVVSACIARYPDVEEITVCDVPLQSCDWSTLAGQAGIDRLLEKYSCLTKPVVRFLDLRCEQVELDPEGLHRHVRVAGDPKGYREVILDGESLLEEISDAASEFRVSDYDPKLTTSKQSKGNHRYLIAASILECDLFINLPKMKTHQKAGITGALKNVVGINGQKAYLVHHRRNKDEFPSDISKAIVLQTRVRDFAQEKSGWLFRLLRAGWVVFRKAAGIEVDGTPENLANGKVYQGAGSWYGNDTIWRMIYDLNKIIRYAPRQGGRLERTPQREYLVIVDGVVAGEGNGPLQPIPVELGVIVTSRDPFLADCCLARLMGFDPQMIPSISNRKRFGDSDWGGFDERSVRVLLDKHDVVGLDSIPALHLFIPPPGWVGHIEAEPRCVESLP
jgi:hypothetical protein